MPSLTLRAARMALLGEVADDAAASRRYYEATLDIAASADSPRSEIERARKYVGGG